MKLNLKSRFNLFCDTVVHLLQSHFEFIFKFLNASKPTLCSTNVIFGHCKKIEYYHLFFPFSFMSICTLIFSFVYKSYFFTLSSSISSAFYLFMIIKWLQNDKYFTSFCFKSISSLKNKVNCNVAQQTLTNHQLAINGKSLTLFESNQIGLISYWGECFILAVWIFAATLFAKHSLCFVLKNNHCDLVTLFVLITFSVYLTFGKFLSLTQRLF